MISCPLIKDSGLEYGDKSLCHEESWLIITKTDIK